MTKDEMTSAEMIREAAKSVMMTKKAKTSAETTSRTMSVVNDGTTIDVETIDVETIDATTIDATTTDATTTDAITIDAEMTAEETIAEMDAMIRRIAT